MKFYVDIAVFKILFQGNCIVFSTGNSLISCQLSSSCFNTFRLHQIEMKTYFPCLCEAIKWL